MATYKDEVLKAIENARKDVIDLGVKRQKASPPTQASSEFITNSKQGNWAEDTFIFNFNEQCHDYVAVAYGENNDLVAGEEGFSEFYKKYQEELDIIGKRPDILIFKKENYDQSWNYDISGYDNERLDLIVPNAVCGLEIRSSSFAHEVYKENALTKRNELHREIMENKAKILNEYSELLKEKLNNKTEEPEIFNLIQSINYDYLPFELTNKRTNWKKTKEEKEVSYLINKIKENLRELKKRDFLSITPKVEDLKVINNWVQKYNVPHYFVQVFFDVSFGISYLEILNKLNSAIENNRDYFLEKDTKNQNKTTIKINTESCTKIFTNIEEPKHFSVLKHVGERGRLIFYVDFEKSKATFLENNFKKMIGETKKE